MTDTIIALARQGLAIVGTLETLLNDQLNRLGLTSFEQSAVKLAIWLLLLYGSIRLFRGALRLVVGVLLILLLMHAFIGTRTVYS